jgi:hypothetical protein
MVQKYYNNKLAVKPFLLKVIDSSSKKSYNNTRVRGVAQLGRALPWGGRGR